MINFCLRANPTYMRSTLKLFPHKTFNQFVVEDFSDEEEDDDESDELASV